MWTTMDGEGEVDIKQDVHFCRIGLLTIKKLHQGKICKTIETQIFCFGRFAYNYTIQAGGQRMGEGSIFKRTKLDNEGGGLKNS